MCQQATSLTLGALSDPGLVQNINHRLQYGSVKLTAYKSFVMGHPYLGPAGHGIAHKYLQIWLLLARIIGRGCMSKR